MILCNDPGSENISIQSELNKAIQEVLSSGMYVRGNACKRFLNNLCEGLNVAHAVGLNSGTDALFIAFKALNIEAGDEIILPAHTAAPTAVAVQMAGARPVFVDIVEECLTIDPVAVENAITDRTKAVIAVHLYGQPADMTALTVLCRERNIPIIEDCAQAIGAEYEGRKVGSIGEVGCFSFYPTKNLGAVGDGGALVTQLPELAEKANRYSQYGWDEDRNCIGPGINSRLDELQAAILDQKLYHLDRWNDARISNAERYRTAFTSLPLQCPNELPDHKHVYHQFVIRTEKRDDLMEYLRAKGIGAAIHYAVPLHRHPAFMAGKKLTLPVTEKIVDEILSLPVHPELREQDRIINAVSSFFGNGT